jgi:hypothetical protein
MSGPFLLGYLFLWATLMRTLLVKAQVLPPTCARCGLRYERHALGESVCRCHGDRETGPPT